MRVALGVDIGGTGTKLGVVGEDGAIVSPTSVPTSDERGPADLVARIAAAVAPLVATAREAGRTIAGCGVSVAGFLDREREAMHGNANLPRLCGFPLRRALESRLGMQCRLEVDSNAALLAEHRHGAVRGTSRALGVTVGTGLGGAVLVDGQLLRYTGECAGDLGHIILDPDGRPCSCGARGCLEAMVNTAALRERGGGRTVREIIAAAGSGEQGARDALAETGWWLGLGLAALSPVFAPERIVVGGGVAAAGELLLAPTRESYVQHAAPAHAETVAIAGSAFAGWEGIVGAASLVFHGDA